MAQTMLADRGINIVSAERGDQSLDASNQPLLVEASSAACRSPSSVPAAFHGTGGTRRERLPLTQRHSLGGHTRTEKVDRHGNRLDCNPVQGSMRKCSR